ncbi:MAG: carbohydrate ABC transporter substrate-binding protein [Hyphomicrobiales bacterium]|nr:carbohydrate ABC transporter substrate-binding protein [Hyphomicrobiales bacterium]
MSFINGRLLGAAAGIVMFAGPAAAADCEVVHWWTSGGEAAAVAEFAKALDATGEHKWVDGAIGGSGDTARPIIISRITGGQPPCATQFNPGKDADDLIDAGLLLDLSDLAKEEGWTDFVYPSTQLDPTCVRDGKVWCVPVNIHSAYWMWVNRKVYQDAGIDVPATWDDVIASTSTLRDNGIIPLSLAQGWPVSTLSDAIEVSVLGIPNFVKIYQDRDMDLVKGDLSRAVWEKLDEARKLVDSAEIVPQWNDAVGLVITGKAGTNVMGDWAQGEFAVAEQVAGDDYECLAGLGLNDVVSTGGDVFYFPKTDDPEITKAQLKLASLMISAPVQVAFNLKKGSMPIRQDVDLNAANACMKKGLAILANADNIVPNNTQMMQRETVYAIRDLRNEFFTNPDMSVDEAFEQFISLIESAPE